MNLMLLSLMILAGMVYFLSYFRSHSAGWANIPLYTFPIPQTFTTFAELKLISNHSIYENR